VDTDALVARLGEGDFYAAIDVFDSEPLAKNHPLRKLPNAYLTPHRAGGVMESVQRILTWLIDDIEAHLAGRSRQYALTEQMIPMLDG
jgi:phosphoglycerate dehydrogenase-like enzyme